MLLACYGNVPPERAACVMGMLLGVPVSAGWVDKAAARVCARLGKAGFDDAMVAALTAEDVLAADETPVNVLGKTAPQPAAPEEEKEERDPEGKQKAAAGAPHVLIVRTPDGRLTFLQAIGSRRKGDVAGGIPGAFTGALITDGYTAYQHAALRTPPGKTSRARDVMHGWTEYRPNSMPQSGACNLTSKRPARNSRAAWSSFLSGDTRCTPGTAVSAIQQISTPRSR